MGLLPHTQNLPLGLIQSPSMSPPAFYKVYPLNVAALLAVGDWPIQIYKHVSLSLFLESDMWLNMAPSDEDPVVVHSL